MGPIRSALLKHPALILAIGLAGLMLRLAVPAGFMPAVHDGQPVLAFCAGYGTAAVTLAAAETAPSESGADHHGQSQSSANGSCAFADLSVPMIGGADPIQLAAALLFIVAVGLLFAALPTPRAALRLRPPLRGPPLPA